MSVDSVLLILAGVVILGIIVGFSGPAQRRRVDRRIGRMRDPAEGTLEVTAASDFAGRGGAQTATYSLSALLRVAGLPPTRVELSGMATSAKWPQAGDMLPVTADRSSPTEVIIHWNRAPTRKQRARIVAADLALEERQPPTASEPRPGGDGERRSDGPTP